MKIRKTLELINESLSHRGIRWALGSSMCMNLHGMDVRPRDIDIFVHIDDFQAAKRIIEELGGIEEPDTDSNIYLTERFAKFDLSEIGIDLIANFRIKINEDNIYDYKIDFSEINILQGYPVLNLSDWVYLYSIMPGKEHKVDMIKNFLLKKQES